MTTIYDVAKAAGVTAATVSYVLTGKRSVSAATRERVLKYARELGYRPNQIARSLIQQRTKTIGLVVPNIGNPFYAGMAEVAERITYTAGFRIFVTNTYRDEGLAQTLLDDLLARHVDGIIIASEVYFLAQALQTLALRSATPFPLVVCLWEKGGADFTPSINFNFVGAGELAARHLLELGHRRIGVVVDGVGMLPEEIHHSARLAGFQEVLSQAGYPLDPSLLALGNSAVESGKKAGYRLLQRPHPPTAIFASNDMMAIGVIAAAWELGISVPQQLSVVGFDDIEQTAYCVPPLTTVSMGQNLVVEQALDLLFQMIGGQTVVSPPMLQPTLIMRHSTAPPVEQ